MSLFRTPDTSFLTDEDKENIYEPAEDTFLVLDALEKDYKLITSLRPCLALEVGCGSGVVSTFLSQMLQQEVFMLCTDINVHAAHTAMKTAIVNGTSISPVLCDLVSCFGHRLDGLVDILIFNPPYVVTPPEEVGSKDIEAAWAGGVKGRQVLDRLLPFISGLLSATGLFYLVAIRENDTDDIASILLKQGLTLSVVLERRAGREYLMILRFQRKLK